MTNSQKGILLFILAWTFIPVMDGIAKYLSEVENLHVLQIVWGRYFFTVILTYPIVLFFYKKNSLKSENLILQITRGFCLVIATICFFYSISIISLPEALALAFVYPLFVTIFSYYFLKEILSIEKILAVIFGFIGVLFIIKPGFREINLASISAIMTGLAYAFYMILTKKIAFKDTPLKALNFTGLVGFIFLSLIILIAPSIWNQPEYSQWLLLFGIGFVATLGHLLIIISFKYTDASTLAPFSYWEIVTNIIIGYYFFDDFLDIFSWLGLAIIVMSGIYIFQGSNNETRIQK